MRNITTGLLILCVALFSTGIAFAHCGVCGVGEAAPAQAKSADSIAGKVVCLGCTLKKEQGAKAQCSTYGHKNGLQTPDGKIWSFVENDSSAKLIGDHGLAGKSVEVKGKNLDNANYIDVESYKVSERISFKEGHAWMS